MNSSINNKKKINNKAGIYRNNYIVFTISNKKDII